MDVIRQQHPEPATEGLVSVVVPARNEAGHLSRLLRQLSRILESRETPFKIIVVDDGSSDDTTQVAVEAAANAPVKVVNHPTERGLGMALRTGLLEAIADSAVIVTMDADESHDPVLIPRMIQTLHEGHDVVIASRFEEGGAEIGVGPLRHHLRRLTNRAVRLLAPLRHVRDHSTGYRVYRADLIRRLIETQGRSGLVREAGFACQLELLLKASTHGARITEIPLLARYDRKGRVTRKRFRTLVGRYTAVIRDHYFVQDAPSSDHVDDTAGEYAGSERAHRALSLAVAIVGVILAAPLMVAIAVLVKLTSRGPVFYAQTRVGLDRRRNPNQRDSSRRRADQGGRPFRIYKFRTMVHEQSSDQQQVWATPNDPRVTRIGGVLRQLRLDELPQLFNVIRGDMNIVGPRPEQPKIFADLQVNIDRYTERQRVPPGITGWAQVRLAYDQTLDDVRRKVQFDLEYVERRSVLEDLRIMLRTVPAMVFRRGGW